MIIERKLKYIDFKFDEETQEFKITTWSKPVSENEPDFPESVTLNKTYAFALKRFIVRIAQRMWGRRKRP